MSLQEKHLVAPPETSTVDTHDGSDAAIACVDPKVLRRLMLKMDFILLPTLTLTYIFNSLDRSNLGNANTAGLPANIGLVGSQYNLVLTFYYVVFVLFGPVMALFTKVASAKISIPCMMLGFGIASACTASSKNFGQLLACRIFVGIFESGFLASVVFYLSKFYTPTEIASRISLFYAGAVAASAFGGLLAYAVFHIHNAPLYDWAYLFILEGCITCLLAIACFFILPKDIRSAWFLNAPEKDLAESRMLFHSRENLKHEFKWAQALQEFKNIHFYSRALIALSFGILAQVNANFLAIITVRLGYSTVKTNLYTVAPACVSAVAVVALAFSSDHFVERGIHMTIPLVLSLVGYIMLMTIDVSHETGLGYFAIFLCTVGAYPQSVIFSAWTVSNIPNLNARAFTTGVLFALASSDGLIASNVFFNNEAPRYISALIVNAAFSGCCIVFTLSYSMYLRILNKRLDRAGNQDIGPTLDDHEPRVKSFRFQT